MQKFQIGQRVCTRGYPPAFEGNPLYENQTGIVTDYRANYTGQISGYQIRFDKNFGFHPRLWYRVEDVYEPFLLACEEALAK